MSRIARMLSLLLVLAITAACGGGGSDTDEDWERQKKKKAAKKAAEKEKEYEREREAEDKAKGSGEGSAKKRKKKKKGDILEIAIEYPAADKSKLVALEKDIMKIGDEGSGYQSEIKKRILAMGKKAVPALLNAFRTLDHNNEDQRGIGNFLDDMLIRIYEPDDHSQYDPMTEGEPGLRSRQKTVRKWINLYEEQSGK